MTTYPSDWKIRSVAEIGEVGRGRVISHEEIRSSSYHQYPVYSSQTVNDGEMGRIDSYDFDGEYITWTTDGVNAGSVFYRSGKFNCTNVCGTIKPFSDDAQYVAFALRPLTQRYVATNLANPKLMNGVMKTIEIPLPPLPEQKRIAGVLGDMDKLIENLGKRIEKKRQVKKGAMQELLTGKKRLSGFKGEWVEHELKDIGMVSKGTGINRAESDTGNIPAVRYGEIYTHHNDYVKDYISHISPEVAAKSRLTRRGDVLFAGSGETVEDIGKSVSVVEDGVYAGGDIIVFSPYEATDPKFFGYLLNMPYVQKQKSMLGHGATIVHLRPEGVASLRVRLPMVPEQRAIAAVLSDMDAEIANLERRQEKLKQVKKGMLQDLLTGKVRLKGQGGAT